ncbi:MAG: cysteine hydrolase family protein [Vagococcus sp.]
MEPQIPQYKGALIVIDMVYDFVNPNGSVYYESNKQVLENVTKLIPEAKSKGLLIIYIQHSHRKGKFDKKTLIGRKNCLEGTGGDLLDSSLPIDYENDYILKKRRYSAFDYTDLDLILREHNIKNVVICGTKTNNCVRSTVEDAYHLDYDVYVVSDCVGTDKKEVNDIYLYDINRYYGTVVSSDQLLNQLGGDN